MQGLIIYEISFSCFSETKIVFYRCHFSITLFTNLLNLIIMLPYRTEIRNSPKEQTLKIYLNDISLDQELKNILETIVGVRLVEVQESVGRNRVEENVTVFRNEDTSINVLKEKVDTFLDNYFKKLN